MARKKDPVKSIALHAAEDQVDSTAAFQVLLEWVFGDGARGLALHEVEGEVDVRGREVLRLLLQEHANTRGGGDVGPAVAVATPVEGEGAVTRLVVHSERRERRRGYRSRFGDIFVDRLSFEHEGEVGVRPLDEELALPKRLYSYPVQKILVTGVARGPFAEAVKNLEETIGVAVAPANADDVTVDAALDFDGFYEARAVSPPEKTSEVLVATLDGKGVPMKKPPADEPRPKRRRKKGEKPNKKREARVAAVYTVEPYVRTVDDVLKDYGPSGPVKEAPRLRPRPEEKRVWASLKKSKDEVFDEVAAEMQRRDPARQKRWVCVTDGDAALQKRALSKLGKLGVALTLILDIFHVLEYLWDAAHAFHGEGTNEANEWVRKYLRLILEGRASEVARGLRQSATKHGLRGSKRKAVDKAANYFLNHKDFMRYEEYLAAGLPIGSGVAEGTCKHLVKDRFERTGMRWTVETAEAVLRMRAIECSGDTDAYWLLHIAQEQKRLHGWRRWRAQA
jgi:hypothetical protein